MTGVSTYEEDASVCLNDCLWPMLNDCPEWCSRQECSGTHRKNMANKGKAMSMLLKGKNEALIANICGVQSRTIRRWATELEQLMEEP